VTVEEAVEFLVTQFVRRFGCDAEGCTNKKLTQEAIRVLTGKGCPCENCRPDPEE
jgi:hypothetical protein